MKKDKQDSSEEGTPKLNLLATVDEVEEHKEESKLKMASDGQDDFYKQFEAQIASEIIKMPVKKVSFRKKKSSAIMQKDSSMKVNPTDSFKTTPTSSNDAANIKLERFPSDGGNLRKQVSISQIKSPNSARKSMYTSEHGTKSSLAIIKEERSDKMDQTFDSHSDLVETNSFISDLPTTKSVTQAEMLGHLSKAQTPNMRGLGEADLKDKDMQFFSQIASSFKLDPAEILSTQKPEIKSVSDYGGDFDKFTKKVANEMEKEPYEVQEIKRTIFQLRQLTKATTSMSASNSFDPNAWRKMSGVGGTPEQTGSTKFEMIAPNVSTSQVTIPFGQLKSPDKHPIAV